MNEDYERGFTRGFEKGFETAVNHLVGALAEHLRPEPAPASVEEVVHNGTYL